MIKKFFFGLCLMVIAPFVSGDPLLEALMRDDYDGVSMLLQERTPVTAAFIEELERNGRIYHLYPGTQTTFAHYACFNPSALAIDAMIYNEMNLNAQDVMGRTPLHLLVAYMKSQESSIKLVVKSGADINRKNKNGDTPLMYALGLYVSRGMVTKHVNIDNVATLLELGADPDQPNKFGFSARTLIQNSRYKPYQDLLRRYDEKRENDENVKKPMLWPNRKYI